MDEDSPSILILFVSFPALEGVMWPKQTNKQSRKSQETKQEGKQGIQIPNGLGDLNLNGRQWSTYRGTSVKNGNQETHNMQIQNSTTQKTLTPSTPPPPPAPSSSLFSLKGGEGRGGGATIQSTTQIGCHLACS